MIWNKDSLKEIVKEKIGEHKFIIVSNREPYIHTYSEEGIKCITPASGMAVALNPVMISCGGIWIAHGSGDADRDAVDERDHVDVPPENPRYSLRRVWLTREEEDGFYYGYSNEGIWPLCHIVYVRPTFRERDWEMYKKANERFAEVVLKEMGDDQGFVFIQDYHFALLSRIIKDRRPDIVVAQFWHIPWPNPEAFRVCPQGEEILNGLLGNDILGFHIRYHCLNFLDTVDRFVEARVDHEKLSVIRGGKETLIRPFPISIDFERIEDISRSKWINERISRIRTDYRIRDRLLGVGIDRMDYTKGIIERFRAIDRFLEKYPEYIGRFVFLQLGPISRIHIPKYKEYNDEIYHTMVDINEKWKVKDWQPIILQKSHLSIEEVISYYRAADLCIVSSIHDGMNLVAKEFVASRIDESGVLILSRFTGASRELESAILVNPIAIDQFANAIKEGLEMPEDEKMQRMRGMRDILRKNNVYRWAGKIVDEMKKLI
ncbi:MAG: trehalose-6-phosphate synthase [Acidobacteriota bacterium]